MCVIVCAGRWAFATWVAAMGTLCAEMLHCAYGYLCVHARSVESSTFVRVCVCVCVCVCVHRNAAVAADFEVTAGGPRDDLDFDAYYVPNPAVAQMYQRNS